MLAEAQRLRAQGLDIVVGVVETHGRKDTAAMLEGLAVLPLKRRAYRGRHISEFDLDAALARRPALILRTNWRTVMRQFPSSQTLAGYRRTAGSWH